GQKATVLCVVPQHLEEGKEIALAKPEMELALGQPVMFPLYTSTVRAKDNAGDVLEVAPEQLAHLPPLPTVLRSGQRSGPRRPPRHWKRRATNGQLASAGACGNSSPRLPTAVARRRNTWAAGTTSSASAFAPALATRSTATGSTSSGNCSTRFRKGPRR